MDLRAKYLFELARTCNVPPTAVLKLRDMFQLIIGIDEMIANQED